MRLMRFHFKEITHVPGKQLYLADTLSRMQRKHQTTHPTIREEEMNIYIASVLKTLPISDTNLQQVKEAEDEDEVCKNIKAYCLEGWPDKHTVND